MNANANDYKMDIKELLTIYPYVAQKIKEIHKDIIEYEELMADARQEAIKAQVLTDMPHGSGVGNPTQSFALQMIDDFYEQIEAYKNDIKKLKDIKKWGDKLRMELFGKDWEILYLVYSKQKSNWTIQNRFNINIKCVDDAILRATERARKLIN